MLECVLLAIRTSGLPLKPDKCPFAYKELKCLNHVINAKEVLPDPAKTLAIANFPIPKNKKGVGRFFGMFAYYGGFAQTLHAFPSHSRA